MTLAATIQGLAIPLRREPRSYSVAILLYPGVDVMDLAGPYSVFGYAHMRIRTVAKADGPIRAGGGLTLRPDYTFANFPGADIVVVPGGGPAEHNQDKEIINWVTSLRSSIVVSVCSGAFFLAKAGMLDGLSATTFASLIPQLQKDAPQAQVVDDRRYVDNGRVITSAGLTSGIDAAFQVVKRLYGEGRARQVANQMEYNWEPRGNYVRALLADKHLDHSLAAFSLFTDSLISLQGDRDWYETEIRVLFPGSESDLAKLVDHTMKSQPSYKKIAGQGLSSQWFFHDDNKQLWKSSINGLRQSSSAFRFRIRVERDINAKP